MINQQTNYLVKKIRKQIPTTITIIVM